MHPLINTDSVAIILGALFGLCLLLLLLVLTINGVLILKSKLHHTTRSSNTGKKEYYSNINDSKTQHFFR